ncbi:MAG: hypothetical protein OEZ48_03745 [Candidatus Bathyarchaeota archaeon]|nr:hypothetical protein [Candidatus Bathyarchaeota archaeon]
MHYENIGEELQTEEQEFAGACIFTVKVGTNASKGGDAGHGAKTTVVFDSDNAAWSAIIEDHHGGKHRIDEVRSVSSHLFGDEEARVLAEAPNYVAETVEKQIGHGSEVSTAHPAKERRIVVCCKCGSLYDIHYVDDVEVRKGAIVKFRCRNCGMVPLVYSSLFEPRDARQW